MNVPQGFASMEFVSGQSPPGSSIPLLIVGVEIFEAVLKTDVQFHVGHQWPGERSLMSRSLNLTGKTG